MACPLPPWDSFAETSLPQAPGPESPRHGGVCPIPSCHTQGGTEATLLGLKVEGLVPSFSPPARVDKQQNRVPGRVYPWTHTSLPGSSSQERPRERLLHKAPRTGVYLRSLCAGHPSRTGVGGGAD